MLAVCLRSTRPLKYNDIQFKAGRKLYFNLESIPIEILHLTRVKSLVPSKSTSNFLVKQLHRLLSELNDMEKKLKQSGGAWILEVKNSRVYSAPVRAQACETPVALPEKLEAISPVVPEVPIVPEVVAAVASEVPTVPEIVETIVVAPVTMEAVETPVETTLETLETLEENPSTVDLSEEPDGVAYDLLTVVPNEGMKLDTLMKIAAARGIATKRGMSKKAVVDRILDPK